MEANLGRRFLQRADGKFYEVHSLRRDFDEFTDQAVEQEQERLRKRRKADEAAVEDHEAWELQYLNETLAAHHVDEYEDEDLRLHEYLEDQAKSRRGRRLLDDEDETWEDRAANLTVAAHHLCDDDDVEEWLEKTLDDLADDRRVLQVRDELDVEHYEWFERGPVDELASKFFLIGDRLWDDDAGDGALECYSEDTCGDRDLVLSAIANGLCPSLYLIDSDLRGDPEIVFGVIDICTTSQMRNTSFDLRSDPSFVLRIIDKLADSHGVLALNAIKDLLGHVSMTVLMCIPFWEALLPRFPTLPFLVDWGSMIQKDVVLATIIAMTTTRPGAEAARYALRIYRHVVVQPRGTEGLWEGLGSYWDPPCEGELIKHEVAVAVFEVLLRHGPFLLREIRPGTWPVGDGHLSRLRHSFVYMSDVYRSVLEEDFPGRGAAAKELLRCTPRLQDNYMFVKMCVVLNTTAVVHASLRVRSHINMFRLCREHENNPMSMSMRGELEHARGEEKERRELEHIRALKKKYNKKLRVVTETGVQEIEY